MDCVCFVPSIKTEGSNKYLKISEDLFNFSNLDKNDEKFSNKDKKVIGKFEIETPKKLWID